MSILPLQLLLPLGLQAGFLVGNYKAIDELRRSHFVFALTDAVMEFSKLSRAAALITALCWCLRIVDGQSASAPIFDGDDCPTSECEVICLEEGEAFDHWSCHQAYMAEFSKDSNLIGSSLQRDARVRIVKVSHAVDDMYDALSILHGAMEEDTGVYRCRGWNDCHANYTEDCQCVAVFKQRKDVEKCKAVDITGDERAYRMDVVEGGSVTLAVNTTGPEKYKYHSWYSNNADSGWQEYSGVDAMSAAIHLTNISAQDTRFNYYLFNFQQDSMGLVEFTLNVIPDTGIKYVELHRTHTHRYSYSTEQKIKLSCPRPKASGPQGSRTVYWKTELGRISARDSGFEISEEGRVLTVDTAIFKDRRDHNISCSSNPLHIFLLQVTPPPQPAAPWQMNLTGSQNFVYLPRLNHTVNLKYFANVSLTDGLFTLLDTRQIESWQPSFEATTSVTPAQACDLLRKKRLTYTVTLYALSTFGLYSQASMPLQWSTEYNGTTRNIHTIDVYVRSSHSCADSFPTTNKGYISVESFARAWHQKMHEIVKEVCSCCDVMASPAGQSLCPAYNDSSAQLNCAHMSAHWMRLRLEVTSPPELSDPVKAIRDHLADHRIQRLGMGTSWIWEVRGACVNSVFVKNVCWGHRYFFTYLNYASRQFQFPDELFDMVAEPTTTMTTMSLPTYPDDVAISASRPSMAAERPEHNLALAIILLVFSI